MSRRCLCQFCREYVTELIGHPQNFCIKCWDEYCAIMATYRTRHADADGKQLTLPVDTKQRPYP